MDPKTAKKLLKDANDAIKAKNFDQADELTSRILMFDGRNYNALIFRGLCRENGNLSEEALSCYRTAVEIKPEMPLGWQALVSFFEKRKNEADSDDLMKAYLKLMQITDVSNPKRPDWLLCYLQLLMRAQRHEEALSMAEKEVERLALSEQKCRIQILMTDLYRKQSQHEKLLALEEDIIQNSSEFFVDDPHTFSDIIRSYILNLRKTNCDAEHLKMKCSDVLIIQPGHALALETAFLIHLEEVLTATHIFGELAVKDLEKRALGLPSEHPFHALLRGLEKWMGGYPDEALDALDKDIEPLKIGRWRVTALLRTRLAAAMHRVAICRETHTKPPERHQNEAIHSEGIAKAIQFFYWRCCVTAGDCSQVAHICRLELPSKKDDLVKEGSEWRVLIASMFIVTGALKKAEKILEGMEASESVHVQLALRCCQASLLLARENYQEVLSLLDHDDANAEALILKGKALWALGDFEKSFFMFVEAADKDKWSWEAFLFIGKYQERQQMFDDARTSYRRSFQLNRNSQNGEALCDLLFKRRRYKDALKILDQVTMERTDLKWAWFRMGNIHWAMKNPSDAVYAYQKACDRNDPIVYDCLGDCNSALGSNETAVKNYKEALKLDPQREYSQMRIAALQHKLGLYHTAVEEYHKALKLASERNQVQVFKGLGDTYLAMASEALQQRLIKLAIAHNENSIHFLTKAFCMRPRFSSIARSLADALFLLHSVSDLDLQLRIPAILLSGSFTEEHLGEAEKEKTVDKEKMLQIATKLYSTALLLKNDCPDTWSCLGFALLQLAITTSNHVFIEEAECCVRQALSLREEDSDFWNLLGLVYSLQKHTVLQAQHCFIQAIQLDSKNAVAWSNLGFFYLINEKLKLAYEVFYRSQSEDTTCPLPWLGQGRIARATDRRHDALNLFRHSLELGHTEFGALSYARLVLHFAHNIEKEDITWFHCNIVQLNAFGIACEALEHSLELDPLSKMALYCQALLSNRLGNDRVAEKCIKRFLDLSPNPDLNLQLNSLRVLEFGKTPAERMQLPQLESKSLRHLCIFGYLEASRGNLEKAIEYYEQAIKLSSSPLEKAEIAAAVGFHAFAADDMELTSDWLFQSNDEDGCSPKSILGFAAFSVLTGDSEVASCLQADLSDMTDEPHVAYLLSLTLRLTASDMEGRSCLLKAVFRRPSDARLWHYLSRYLLTSRDEENEAGPLSAHAAEVALALRPTVSAHARLLGEVFRRFGDCLGRRLERRICGLFRLFPSDPVARKNVAAVASRQSDHAERGAVARLRSFARAIRELGC